MLKLFAILACLSATSAYSLSWRVEGFALPSQLNESLHARFPNIENQSDLQTLLEEIGLKTPKLRLEAFLRDQVWVIEGEDAKVISEISVQYVPRDIRSKLENKLHNYVGNADSAEIRKRIQNDAQQMLRKSGYFNAKFELKEEISDTVELDLIADIGDPCTTDRVEYPFPLPRGFSLDVRMGELCDEQEILPAIEQLEEKIKQSGYTLVRLTFDSFSLNENKTHAVVVLKGSLGQKIRYKINDSSKRFIIDDLFATDELSKIDPTIIGPEAMANELTQRYRNKGFIDVTVTGPEVQNVSDNETVYSFDIEPGQQYILTHLKIEGMSFFTEEKLLETMGTGRFWQSQGPYKPDEIKKGIDAIKSLYLKEGFWDIQVTDRSPAKDRERASVQIVITVDEGPQRILKSVAVSGNTAIPSDELLENFPINTGQSIDRSKLIDAQQAIRFKYIKQGYLYSTVEIKFAESKGRVLSQVDVTYVVHEGERVKVGDITVIGLSFTDPKVVTRELTFKSGDWYDPTAIADSRKALLKLGFFRSIQIYPADPNATVEKRKLIDLIVEVREGITRTVSFGPGWNTYSGQRYSIESSYTNILGTGRQLFGRAGISEEKQQPAIDNKTLVGRTLVAGYVEPYVLDFPWDGNISTRQTSRATEDTWELIRSGEIGLTHSLKKILPGASINPFYAKKITVTEGESQKVDSLVADNVSIGRFGIRFNVDERNNTGWPSDGYMLETDLSWARYYFSGDIEFFRWQVTNNYFFDLTHNFVFALSLSFTSYESIRRKNSDNGDILPYSERVRTGGAESVRGFREGILGPVIRYPTLDSNRNWSCGAFDSSYAGGSRSIVIKNELRYRISEMFGVTSFIDSGTAFFSNEEERKFKEAFAKNVSVNNPNPACQVQPQRSIEDNNPYELGEIWRKPRTLWVKNYYSYGVAGNVLLPIGSLNVAYGIPWREPESDYCQSEGSLCYKRSRDTDIWWLRGEFHLNVGAKF